jgi:hypothetical protein
VEVYINLTGGFDARQILRGVLLNWSNSLPNRRVCPLRYAGVKLHFEEGGRGMRGI